jgi:predicted metalloprotease with PDZ domain
MAKIVGAALVFGVAVWAGAALGAEAPLMTVTISPGPMDEHAKAGEVRIVEVIPDLQAAAGEPLFEVQGDDLEVSDERGPVRREGEGENYTPARELQGDLTVRYRVKVETTPDNGGTTPIRPRLDGHGFSALGMTMLAVPDIKRPYRVRLVWDLSGMGPGATAVSSFGDGSVDVAAMPLSRLGRSIFMAGELHREPQPPAKGRFSAVWSGDPGFDLRPAMQWTEKLHAWMVDFFRTPNDPAYRVFLRLNGARNPGGGVAFPNSFFATYGPGVTGESLKNILGHEMVHTFTAHDLGKWYDEGNAVYYQVQLPWRAGMVTTETYLRDINLTAARYYTNAEIDSPEEKIIPNFFKDTWLNTLGYDRGALYFAILNGKIRRASHGQRSVDDLLREMVRRDRGGETLTEAAWLDLVRKEIGEEGVALHRKMIAGGVILPESDDYGPCFRRVPAKIRRYELGFTPKTLPDRRAEVTALVAGSEAAKAGLKNGDVMTMPVITTEGAKRDPQRTLTAPVTRDGRTFEVTWLPRTAATIDAWQWERVSGVPDSACRP